MSRRSLALAPVLAALVFAAPALADQTGSVTATGSAEVKVAPTNRHSNASIAAAVAVAEKQAVPGALSAAHTKALLYAQDAGLTLGSVLSISDAQSGEIFIGPDGQDGDIGTFGPGKFCGTVSRPVYKKVTVSTGTSVSVREKLVRVRHVHTCEVPAYATSTLAVTYSAT